jgi:hypothetical protein
VIRAIQVQTASYVCEVRAKSGCPWAKVKPGHVELKLCQP